MRGWTAAEAAEATGGDGRSVLTPRASITRALLTHVALYWYICVDYGGFVVNNY
jgi:hypothetical protein